MVERPALDKDLVIDIMASWALEGMSPSQQTVDDLNSLIEGSMTLEEFRHRTQEMAHHSG